MAHITQILFSGLGGHAAVAFALAAEFQRQGYASSLLFFGVEPLLDQHRERCERAGIPFRYVAKRPGLALASQRELWHMLETWGPGCVLTHGCSAGPAALAYRLHRGVPWLVRETQANHLKSRREHWLALFGALCADRMIFLTPEYRDEVLARHRGWGRHRSLVIPNGLDLELFRPGESPPAAVRRVGMVSRMTPIKDHGTLLEAVARLSGTFTLELAGSGSELPRWRELAEQLGLGERVRFHGVLSEEQVADFLRGLDLYVHATLGETMSTAILQAMGTGLPILASDVPGVSNLLTHGVTGWLAPPGSPPHWAEALQLLESDGPLRERLGRAARELAVRNYSVEAQAQRYLALYPR